MEIFLIFPIGAVGALLSLLFNINVVYELDVYFRWILIQPKIKIDASVSAFVQFFGGEAIAVNERREFHGAGCELIRLDGRNFLDVGAVAGC